MIDFKNKRVMVVVAHPDDELLGVGATINYLVTAHNATVHVVILGEGITSRGTKRDTSFWASDLIIHKSNIDRAKKALGYSSVSIYDFPDNRFDTIALLDIVKVIELEKASFKPNIIFTHHGGDLNIDHQRTFEAVITATRPLEGEVVQSIITFETPSGTEWRASSDPRHFVPNFYIKLNKENLQAKINAMECYEFEKRPYPHPRSTKALEILAQRHGITIGTEFAEAFCIVRTIF